MNNNMDLTLQSYEDSSWDRKKLSATACVSCRSMKVSSNAQSPCHIITLLTAQTYRFDARDCFPYALVVERRVSHVSIQLRRIGDCLPFAVPNKEK